MFDEYKSEDYRSVVLPDTKEIDNNEMDIYMTLLFVLLEDDILLHHRRSADSIRTIPSGLNYFYTEEITAS